MIYPTTRLRVADNTGARSIMCIQVLAGGNKMYADVGDVIVASVKQAQPGGAVKKGDVVKAVDRADGQGVRPRRTARTSGSTTTPP